MLETLTTELVENIAGLVDDKSDLFALRLVSRQLCLKTSTAFGKAWFNTLDSDLSQQSLQRLDNIAHHEKFRLFVHRLRIGDCNKGPCERPLGQGNHWAREASGCLDVSSPIISSFHDWLADSFTNCGSFEVTDSCGRYPEQDGTAETLSPADAVQLLFFAIAGRPVRSFRIRQARMYAIMFPNQVSLAVTTSIMFRSSWSSYLQDLELSWRLEYDDLFRIAKYLVVIAQNLRRLRLNWQHSSVPDRLFQELAEADTLPRITDLRLSGISRVTRRSLSGFLFRFQDSLTFLDLSHIYLHSATGSFSSVFNDLQRNFSQLEYIKILNISENSQQSRVLFCPLRQRLKLHDYGNYQFLETHWKGRHRVRGIMYKGKGDDMKIALETLEECTYVLHKSRPPSPEPSNENPDAEGQKVLRVQRFIDPVKFEF